MVWGPWEEYDWRHYAGEPEEVLVQLMRRHCMTTSLGRVIADARCLVVAWTYLESHLKDRRAHLESLLSQTLKTERPKNEEQVLEDRSSHGYA